MGGEGGHAGKMHGGREGEGGQGARAGAQRPGGMGGGIYPPNIFGSVGNFLFHSVKIAAVGKSRC